MLTAINNSIKKPIQCSICANYSARRSRASTGGGEALKSVASKMLVQIESYDAYELEVFSSLAWKGFLQLDIDKVEQIPIGNPPQGAKGAAAASSGMLLLSISNSAAVAAIVGFLRSWISRTNSAKITIKIGDDQLEITRSSREDQANLIRAWLDRNG